MVMQSKLIQRKISKVNFFFPSSLSAYHHFPGYFGFFFPFYYFGGSRQFCITFDWGYLGYSILVPLLKVCPVKMQP